MPGSSNSAESSNTGASRGALLKLNQYLNSQRNIFICARCKKTFPTTYALGGHQNAHRRERSKERRVSMEERRLKAMENTPVIPCPTPLMAVPSTEDTQIIDYLAKPLAKLDRSGASHGSMPWFEPGLIFDDEFFGDNMPHMCDQIKIPYGAGRGHDEMNYQYYLKYIYNNPKPKPKEQDLGEKKELIALSTGQGGDWIKEHLPVLHVTEKGETSRAFNGGYYEAELTSYGNLDLTLRL